MKAGRGDNIGSVRTLPSMLTLKDPSLLEEMKRGHLRSQLAIGHRRGSPQAPGQVSTSFSDGRFSGRAYNHDSRY